jgi:hypothetical protein
MEDPARAQSIPAALAQRRSWGIAANHAETEQQNHLEVHDILALPLSAVPAVPAVPIEPAHEQNALLAGIAAVRLGLDLEACVPQGG